MNHRISIFFIPAWLYLVFFLLVEMVFPSNFYHLPYVKPQLKYHLADHSALLHDLKLVPIPKPSLYFRPMHDSLKASFLQMSFFLSLFFFFWVYFSLLIECESMGSINLWGGPNSISPLKWPLTLGCVSMVDWGLRM